MNPQSRVVVCAITCGAVCFGGCLSCVADNVMIILDTATGAPSFATGAASRPQD